MTAKIFVMVFHFSAVNVAVAPMPNEAHQFNSGYATAKQCSAAIPAAKRRWAAIAGLPAPVRVACHRVVVKKDS